MSVSDADPFPYDLAAMMGRSIVVRGVLGDSVQMAELAGEKL